MTSATMQSANDANWFTVNLTAGVTYDITLNSLTPGWDFELVYPSGDDSVATVDETEPTAAGSQTFNFSADETGTYYLYVRDYEDGDTGPYSLNAAVVTDSYTLETPGMLTVGKTFNATMESASDADWFEITLTAGVTYDFSENGLGPDTYLDILSTTKPGDDPEGVSPYAPDGTGSSLQNYSVDTSGTYYLEVRDASDNATGPYTVSAVVVPDSYTLETPGTLTVGGSITPKMESASDTDWFKITLTAGVTYDFTLKGLGDYSQFDVISSVVSSDDSPYYYNPLSDYPAPVSSYAPDGTVSQTLNYSVDVSGTYYIEVRDTEDNYTGPYTLSAVVVPDSYTISHPGVLTVGGSLTPTMQSASDQDWFTIALTKGVTYDFTESGLGGEVYFGGFSLSKPTDYVAGVSTTAPDAVGSGLINYSVDVTGTYYFGVRDANEDGIGPYTVAAKVVTDSYTLEHPGTLTIGGTITPTMESAGDADWFKVSLTRGVTYDFTETAPSSDFSFDLVSASGASDDPENVYISTPYGTYDETTNYTADVTGSYYIEVRDTSDGATGAYTLGAVVVPDTYTLDHPGVVTVGTPLTAKIESASDADWFTISLTKGVTYDITLSGLPDYSDFDLLSPTDAGDSLAPVETFSDDDSVTETLNYSVDTTGTYEIEVRDDEDNYVGPYTLSAVVVPDSYTLETPGSVPIAGEGFTGGGQTINLSNVPGNTADLASTANNWDAVSGTSGVVYLTNAQASISGGGDSVYFAGGTGNAASLYQTNGTWDGVNGSGGTVYLTSSQTTVTGGGDTVDFSSGTGNAVGLYVTDDAWDAVDGSKGVIYLTGAQTTITGGGDAVYFSGGTGNAVSLYSTGGAWDGVSGSKGTIYLTSAQTTITGGGDTAMFSGGAGDAVGLYSTAGVWDAVDGSKGQIYLTSAQTTVTGGGDSIYFSGGSGNAISLYATANVWDGVSGSSGTVYLSGAQTTITGGSDTAVFASGTGNAVGLYATGNNWDTVSGSSGLIYLTSAQASVIGGLDTIDVSGGSGNAVSLYGTNNVWDTVNGANTLVYLTSAQTSVIGGGDQVTFSGGSGNLASLAGTAGSWDYVSGSSGTVDLYTAQATVSGSSDTLNLNGASAATLLGGSDTVAFAQGIGGQDLVYDFASSDIMQLSKTDFASFTALSSHLTQSGANAVITLNSADTITLYNTTASGLTSAEFRFV